MTKIHIVGIGGSGMSGLARLLIARGDEVSGSDAKSSRRTAALAAEGATVFVGHKAEQVVDASGNPMVDLVAASTAVPLHNPELEAARDAGIPVWTRADLLCDITDRFKVISVAGTHGKTTTTSMLAVALQAARVDPSFAIGSELSESGANAHLGKGEWFVVEADESDGTFLRLSTKVAIVTNIEPDHLNYWGEFAKLEAAFVDFANVATHNSGFAVACADDEGVQRLLTSAVVPGIRTYGLADTADYRIELLEQLDNGWRFAIHWQGKDLVRASLNVPGVHNVLNATAALAVVHGIGADLEAAAVALAMFRGARRRFDFKGMADGVRVYDDYAHHPTEIAATLRAARQVVGNGRVVVAFEAHHYYRTALFSKEFGAALGLADEVVVLEVFAPGEEFIEGASGSALAANVTLPTEQVKFQPAWSEVPADLVERSAPGDLIMTLGAGEIGMLSTEILQLLSVREAARSDR